VAGGDPQRRGGRAGLAALGRLRMRHSLALPPAIVDHAGTLAQRSTNKKLVGNPPVARIDAIASSCSDIAWDPTFGPGLGKRRRSAWVGCALIPRKSNSAY